VTTMKSQGCQFCEDGDRRPASRIWSRSAAGIGRSAKDRTLRREVIASQVCMTISTPATPRSFSAAGRWETAAAQLVRGLKRFSERVVVPAPVTATRRRMGRVTEMSRCGGQTHPRLALSAKITACRDSPKAPLAPSAPVLVPALMSALAGFRPGNITFNRKVGFGRLVRLQLARDPV